MVYASEEISVVANLHWQVCLGVMLGEQRRLLQRGVVLQDLGMRSVRGEDVLQIGAHFSVDGLAQRGESVQRRLGEDGDVLLEGGQRGEATVGGEGFEVEDVVADGHSGPLLNLRVAAGDDAKGDVGQREMAVGGDGEPGRAGRHGDVIEASGSATLRTKDGTQMEEVKVKVKKRSRSRRRRRRNIRRKTKYREPSHQEIFKSDYV